MYNLEIDVFIVELWASFRILRKLVSFYVKFIIFHCLLKESCI